MSSYVFLGAPGAGKGTMAEMLCARAGQAHISTGDLLRAEMKSGSELGLRAKAFVEKGTLVPDEVVAAMVSAKLGQSDVRNQGFVLDGYPRTVRQAELLAEALRTLGLKLDAVILFEVGEELILRRLTSRWLCRSCGAIYNLIYLPPAREGICDKCGGPLYQRADDSLETARNRLVVYERETSPLIELYGRQGLLLRVTGAEEKHANFAVLCRALGL
jgi:adenylate kinase